MCNDRKCSNVQMNHSWISANVFILHYVKLLHWFFLFVSPQAGNYDESIRHLEFLQELNKDDFKISMNKAIVEFYKSGQTAIGNLKQSLMATIKSQVLLDVESLTFSHILMYYWICPLLLLCLPFFISSLPSFLGVHVNRRHWRPGRCWKQFIALQSSHYSLPHASVFGGHLHRREAVPVPGTVWYAFKSSWIWTSSANRLQKQSWSEQLWTTGELW